MASAETSEVFNCDLEEFYEIITDYESYSDFLPEVKSCKVIKKLKNKKLVEYKVSVIKDFTYRLWMDESKAPKQLTWELESGDLFKVSNGKWNLKKKGKKTEATYWVEAKFKMFVPSPVSKKLVSVSLPNMMKAYQKRIKELT